MDGHVFKEETQKMSRVVMCGIRMGLLLVLHAARGGGGTDCTRSNSNATESMTHLPLSSRLDKDKRCAQFSEWKKLSVKVCDLVSTP